ncbi:ribosome assembly cofactor RimP [Bacteroidota bacterium]
MITKDKIIDIVRNNINETDLFLVDVKIGSSNKINVFIDSNSGVNIQDCTIIHKAIVNELEMSNLDFELQVSSPGIDASFKVMEQYLKNIEKEIEIISFDGVKTRGTLLSVNDEEILIKERIITKGGKDVGTNMENIHINLKNINSAKLIHSY